jgi:hypothetical protein
MAEKSKLSTGALAVRWIVWILFVIWAGAWCYVKISDGMAAMADGSAAAFAGHIVIPVILLIVFLVSLRWPLLGGILMILYSVAAFFQFSLDFSWTFWREPNVFNLVLPGIALGLLFIISWQLARKK